MTTDAEVYEKHAEELTRFATALVGPSDAPDIVSTAVVNALSSSSWPTVENRRAYLYRCVLNAVRSGHRSTVRRERREVRVVERGVLEPPELRPEVLEAVRSLSDLAGGSDGANEMTTFMGLASKNSAAVVTAILKEIQ